MNKGHIQAATMQAKITAKELFTEGVTTSNLTSRLNRLPKSQRERLTDKGIQRLRDGLTKLHNKAAKARRRNAEAASAKSYGMSVASYRRAREGALSIARDVKVGYSMGHIVMVYIDDHDLPIYKHDTTEEYSRSCKYKATHGECRIRMTKRDLLRTECIGGIGTVILGGGKVKKAKWIRNVGKHSSHSVEWVHGYVTGTYHSLTMEGALEWRKGEAERLFQRRAERRSERERIEAASLRFVGIDACLSAGMCEAGVRSFCQRHRLNPTHGYRIDYLLSLMDQQDFIMRLV